MIKENNTGLAATIAEIIAATVAVLEEMKEDDSRPGPPATAEAIAAAEQARSITFSPEYRAFLAAADGWTTYTWGHSLFSTRELLTSMTFEQEVAEYDGEIADDLTEAVPIGRSENDAGLVLLLPSGEVVDWLYKEEKRHPTFLAFLGDNRRRLERMRADQIAARVRTEKEWTNAYRDQADAAAKEEIARVLQGAGWPSVPLSPPRVEDSPPPAVDPVALVFRQGGRGVEVRLGLLLYLGASPSPGEVSASWRAFRRHFPVPGELAWAPGDRNVFFLSKQADPDDEAFLSTLAIDEHGFFGVRGSVGDGAAVFNLRGLPPEGRGDDERPRASFLEVFVPASAPPRELELLAADLLDILPVRSGHGGYAVYAIGGGRESDEALEKTFGWCRRFLALDVGVVDGVLGNALTRLHPSGWLTVLGRAFADPLAAVGRLAFEEPIAVFRHGKGVILRAGDAPTLGDVARGEFPRAIATVDRALSPLHLTGYRRVGQMRVGGVLFQTIAQELPPFRAHALTNAFFRRFVDPESFLGPTPIDRGEQLLAALAKQAASPELLEAWAKKKGDFNDLANHLSTAAVAVGLKGEDALAALELIVGHRSAVRNDRMVAIALNNLIVGNTMIDRWDRPIELAPLALEYAADSRDGYLHHALACVYLRMGDREQCLWCVEQASAVGYEQMDTLEKDKELAEVASEPRFLAAVARVTGKKAPATREEKAPAKKAATKAPAKKAPAKKAPPKAVKQTRATTKASKAGKKRAGKKR